MACYDENRKPIPCPSGVPDGTILVSKANDPHLKAYNDSLNLYNKGVQGRKNIGATNEILYKDMPKSELANTIDDFKHDTNTEAYNDYKNTGIMPDREFVSQFTGIKGLATRYDYGYKKPVQPVVYQKPQQAPIKKGQSTPYDDSLTLYTESQRQLRRMNNLKYGENFTHDLDSPKFIEAFNKLGKPKPVETKERKLPYSVADSQVLPVGVHLWKKPVGTPQPQEPTFKRAVAPNSNYPNIDTGAGRPNPIAPNLQQANFDMSKPTKFAFTYPDYTAGGTPDKQQKSLYFPDLGALTSFAKGYGKEPSYGADKSWGQVLYEGNIQKKANGGSLSNFASMRFRKVYDTGGAFKPNKTGLLGPNVGAYAAIGTGLIDAFDTPNQYGRQSTVGTAAKGALSGVAMGSQFGPLGAAIGGGLGLVGSLVSANKQKREEDRMRATETAQGRQNQLAQFSARAAQTPYLTTGRPGEQYFANGGNLKTQFMRFKAVGGTLSKLSSDSVEVKGPSHAQGGVQLPGEQAEVEGGETIKGDYVLSKRLGFAQMHKPIAKAIGLMEQKPLNPITMKSMQRLRDKENSLILMQEYVKNTNNL